MKGWEQFQERTRYNAILRDFPKKDFQSCLMQFRDMQGRMQCGMAPLKIHPLGKKQCICPSAIQTCAERMVPNTIMFSYVQLRYPQHIPGIFSSKRLTYCQNIFGSKMAGNYSIRGQRIRILFQNNVQLQRNILKIFQEGMDGRGYGQQNST